MADREVIPRAPHLCEGLENRANRGVGVALIRMSKKQSIAVLVIVWLCQVSFFLHPYSDIGLLGFIHVAGVIFNLLMLRFTSFDSRGGYSCALFRRGARGHHSSIRYELTLELTRARLIDSL